MNDPHRTRSHNHSRRHGNANGYENTHLALIGPTATGKSALALDAAEALGDVEIVSMDSMQVYRGMDIGTAKATPEDRTRIRHHLIDVAEPSDDWNVARFQAEARAAIADIEARGRRALLVGGTGLYVQAVTDNLVFPGEDEEVRAQLVARVATAEGLADAYAELEQVDPTAAGRIDPNNARRIVRALEVITITGQAFSSFGPGLTAYDDRVVPVKMVGLTMAPPVLASRIARRVEVMRAQGLVGEVDHLADRLSRTAAQAIGYKELLAARAGISTVDEAFDLIVRRTRVFARRQRVWFRRDPRIHWLEVGESSPPLDALLASWSS